MRRLVPRLALAASLLLVAVLGTACHPYVSAWQTCNDTKPHSGAGGLPNDTVSRAVHLSGDPRGAFPNLTTSCRAVHGIGTLEHCWHYRHSNHTVTYFGCAQLAEMDAAAVVAAAA